MTIKIGQGILLEGASAIAEPLVTASSIILLTGGPDVSGILRVDELRDGISFTVASSNSDTGTVNYLLANP